MASAKTKTKGKKVLFFLRGPNPTKEEQAAADKLDGNVVYRNGSSVASDASLEPADVVAGYYPARYDGVAKCLGDGAPAEGSEEESESSGGKAPETADELKAALDVIGVEYKPDADLKTLEKLYKKNS